MKSRSLNLLVILALFFSLLGSAVTVTPAHAASFTVNTTNDTFDLNPGDGLCQDAAGDCSLRAAFLQAQFLGGADTITLPAGTYTLTLGSSLFINDSVTLNGSGAASTIIQASTCDPITTPGGCTPATTRVFDIGGIGSLTLNDVTIQNGNCSACAPSNEGGAIRATSSLTINNSIIKNNKAASNGGAISISSSFATIKINNTTFENNTSGNWGGHIYVNFASAGGNLTVTNSSFSKGQAVNGGAIANFAGGNQTSNVNISNSTFTNNSSSQNGGAVFTDAANAVSNAQTLLINSTVAYNTATGRGGGVAVNNNGNGGPQATITMKNNIIYGNSASVTNPNCDVINAPGSSLVGNSNNLFPASGDFCPTGVSDITTSAAFNTVVSALGNNGGLTQTMELPAGSPAIDGGDPNTCTAAPISDLDQRGVIRPQGAGCDIGAFETGPIIPVVTASNPGANATLTSLSTITVVFNQDMLNDGSAKAANNTVNYLLVERGANGSFDTTSCNGGVVSDDVQQTISTASYSNAGFITTLTLASPLANGTYRLFICGTTSIWSVAGLELNNGANDATVDFTVDAVGSTTSASNVRTTASSLPKTGFAPNKITTLPVQPATLAYAKLGDLWLEIPSLGVKSAIVGVPQNADKTWDVSWLGNDTGWLNGTAFPTWTGNSVLTAHVTNASGLDGPFAALKTLKYGDQVIVHMGGVMYVYEVRETKLSRPYSTNYAFESKQDASYLTLVTCSGYNPLNESYLFRRVVRAVLVSTVSE